MKNIFVSGSTGFLGRHLTQKILDRGDFVFAVVRDELRANNLFQHENFFPVNVHGDWLNSLDNVSFDSFYHLAAWIGSDHQHDDISDIFDANLVLGTKMLEMAKKSKQPAPFIYAQTFWQFYAGSLTPTPNSLYAASKNAFNEIVSYYKTLAGVPAAGLVIYETYGASDKRIKLLTSLANHIASIKQGSNPPPLKLSDGQQEVSFSDINCIANAFLKTADLLSTSDGRNLPTLMFLRNPRVYSLRKTLEPLLESHSEFGEIVEWGGLKGQKNTIKTLVDGPSLPNWAPLQNLEKCFASMIEERLYDQ